MAELADALASGASVGNNVQVLPFNDYPLKGPLKVQPTKGEVLFRALNKEDCREGTAAHVTQESGKFFFPLFFFSGA